MVRVSFRKQMEFQQKRAPNGPGGRSSFLPSTIEEKVNLVEQVEYEADYVTKPFKPKFAPTEMRQLALVAHNHMKPAMKEFIQKYSEVLKKFRITGTQTTMKMCKTLWGEDDPDIHYGLTCTSGPLGGDAQIASLMCMEDLGALIFFIDPLSSHPHQADIDSLVRLANCGNIIVCPNPTSAMSMMHTLRCALEKGSRGMIPSFFDTLESPAVEEYDNQQAIALQNAINSRINPKPIEANSTEEKKISSSDIEKKWQKTTFDSCAVDLEHIKAMEHHDIDDNDVSFAFVSLEQTKRVRFKIAHGRKSQQETSINGINTRVKVTAIQQSTPYNTTKMPFFHPSLIKRLSTNDPTLTSLSLLGDKLTFSDSVQLANALSSNTHLTSLWLNDNHLSDKDIPPIARALMMGKNNKGHPNLKHLSITKNNISNAGVKLLVELMGVIHLEELCLNSNQIGEEGARYLADSLCMLNGNELVDLRLNCNNIGDDGALAFARALDPFIEFSTSTSDNGRDSLGLAPCLKTLHLRNNGIGLKGGNALANHLKENCHVRLVALDGNTEIPEGILKRIGEACLRDESEGMRKKQSTLGESRLKEISLKVDAESPDLESLEEQSEEEEEETSERISLSNRDMTVEETICVLENNGGCSLEQIVRSHQDHPPLQEIKIFNEELDHDTLKRLCRALPKYHIPSDLTPSSPLKTLWLNNNNIGDMGTTTLAIILARLPTLEKLYITKNNIGDYGASQLAHALMEPTCQLKELWLCNNQIGDEGAKALAEALEKNKKLEVLRLNQNKIGNFGAGKFGYVLSKKLCASLKVLALNGNDIDDMGAHSLMVGIDAAKNGKYNGEDACKVSLKGNKISEQVMIEFSSLSFTEV